MQYAPVSGTIQEINENLNDQPGLLNKSPEDEGERFPPEPFIALSELNRLSLGWLCKIKVSDPTEVRSPLVCARTSTSDDIFNLARLTDGRGCVQGSLRVVELAKHADSRRLLMTRSTLDLDTPLFASTKRTALTCSPVR